MRNNTKSSKIKNKKNYKKKFFLMGVPLKLKRLRSLVSYF